MKTLTRTAPRIVVATRGDYTAILISSAVLVAIIAALLMPVWAWREVRRQVGYVVEGVGVVRGWVVMIGRIWRLLG
jgi:hypothetical protein